MGWGRRRPSGELDAQRDAESLVEAHDVRDVEAPATPRQQGLADRHDVVAVRDGVVVEAMLGTQGDLGWVAPDRRCDHRDRNSREDGNRFVASEHHTWPATHFRKLRIPDVTAPYAVQEVAPARPRLSPLRPFLHDLREKLGSSLTELGLLGPSLVGVAIGLGDGLPLRRRARNAGDASPQSVGGAGEASFS